MSKNIKSLAFKIEKGHVTLENQHIYCWFRESDTQTFYVGATWMHPVARAELHLHATDKNARIVGINLEEHGLSLNESMNILAFEVPNTLNRKEAKSALITKLAKLNLLSDLYFGQAPESSYSAMSNALEAWVNEIVLMLQASD